MDKNSTKIWLKLNWFKLGLLVMGLFLVYFLYQISVVQPRIKKEEKQTAKSSQSLEEETRRAEVKDNLDRCIALAKDVLKTKDAIDDKFCAKCDGYAGKYALEKQCLDGCLDLSSKSLSEYKEEEKVCFQRFSTN